MKKRAILYPIFIVSILMPLGLFPMLKKALAEQKENRKASAETCAKKTKPKKPNLKRKRTKQQEEPVDFFVTMDPNNKYDIPELIESIVQKQNQFYPKRQKENETVCNIYIIEKPDVSESFIDKLLRQATTKSRAKKRAKSPNINPVTEPWVKGMNLEEEKEVPTNAAKQEKPLAKVLDMKSLENDIDYIRDNDQYKTKKNHTKKLYVGQRMVDTLTGEEIIPEDGLMFYMKIDRTDVDEVKRLREAMSIDESDDDMSEDGE